LESFFLLFQIKLIFVHAELHDKSNALFFLSMANMPPQAVTDETSNAEGVVLKLLKLLV